MRATTFQFAFAEQQMGTKIDFLSQFVQRLLTYQMCPEPRQLTFAQERKAFEQGQGHHVIDHAVAEKFEPLVVRLAETAVSQRLAQEDWVGERVSDPLGKITHTEPRQRPPDERSLTLNSNSRLTFPAMGTFFA